MNSERPHPVDPAIVERVQKRFAGLIGAALAEYTVIRAHDDARPGMPEDIAHAILSATIEALQYRCFSTRWIAETLREEAASLETQPYNYFTGWP